MGLVDFAERLVGETFSSVTESLTVTESSSSQHRHRVLGATEMDRQGVEYNYQRVWGKHGPVVSYVGQDVQNYRAKTPQDTALDKLVTSLGKSGARQYRPADFAELGATANLRYTNTTLMVLAISLYQQLLERGGGQHIEELIMRHTGLLQDTVSEAAIKLNMSTASRRELEPVRATLIRYMRRLHYVGTVGH
jgi:hypothetical protein